MKAPIDINRETNKMLVFGIKTNSKIPMVIMVSDAYTPDSVYTFNTGDVNGERTFYVRMPRTPSKLVYQIYNANDPQNTGSLDSTFKITKEDVISLPTFPQAYSSKKGIVKSAVSFIQDFAERASKYSAGGSVYRSPDGVFRIDYLDVIIDRESGKELTTPARISQDRGLIEVSKKYFLNLTIPQRVAILLHEVSHFYISADQLSEVQADLNALAIFLGLGYGPVDGADAFMNVFTNSVDPRTGEPSDQNTERNQIIIKFINDFDKKYNAKYK